MNDLLLALRKHQLWCSLGWNDVLGRYRRSVLGPFWITISMAVTISAMGPLYGSLFGSKSENFILHLALGMIVWGFISSTINESCNIFNDSSGIIKQTDLPFFLYVLRVYYRQLVILLHNCIIIPVVIMINGFAVNKNILLAFPALIIASAAMISIGMIFAIFSTRYRDMSPVIQSVITLLFFVTPIIWSPEQLPEARRAFIDYNLLAYYLDLIRKPIMGEIPEMHTWIVAVIATLITTLISVLLVSKYKNRIVYWL